MGYLKALAGAVAAMTLVVVAPASAQHPSWNFIGYQDLLDRLGDDTPTGAGIVVAEIEAYVEGLAYGPNPDSADFAGKILIPMSGDPGNSWHATTVAKFQFGHNWSIAPAINEIYLWSAPDWLTGGFLNRGMPATVPPLLTPGGIKCMNNSWVALSTIPADNEALRRTDSVIPRDDLIMTSGVNNDSGANWPLMSHLFNGITVGVYEGTHIFSDTLPQYDGGGRMKPEIVAPEQFTSFATPKINAAASLLVEVARTDPILSLDERAERSEVIKAAIRAGGKHFNFADGVWTNNPVTSGPDRGVTARPIDNRVGVGTLNINRSHMILTGGEQDGSATPPLVPNADWAGWDLAPVLPQASMYWRIEVPEAADQVSIVLTWHRRVRRLFDGWTMAELDLILWRVDAQGELATLIGDDGIPYFGGGNVVSESTVDNLEHLYVTDLEPGDYVIEARRLDDLNEPPLEWDAAIAWIFPEPLAGEPADIDGDGVVGFTDMLAVLSYWGPCPGCPSDIDGDGSVGLTDLIAVLAAWGEV